MPLIRFHCPGCAREMKIEDRHAGKQARCPKCGAALLVPFQGIAIRDREPRPSPSPPAPSRGEWLEAAAATPNRGVHVPDELQVCPLCGEPMRSERRRACACGKVFCSKECVAEHVEQVHVRSRIRSVFLATVGVLLFVAGITGLLFYWVMDTSVPLDEGRRIHNIGLMQEQRNGILVSLAGLGLGLVLCIYGGGRRTSPPNPPPPGAPVNLRSTRFCPIRPQLLP